MPFCSNCGSEYEPGVERCPDCEQALVEAMPPKYPDAEPDASLVEIYAAGGDVEALVIKGLLESEGIVCYLSSDVPHSVIPVDIDGLGTVRIAVSEKDAERAEQLISSHKTESD